MDSPNARKESKPRLLELVNTLQTQIQSIQSHLTETNQPDPSFVGTESPTDYDGIDDTRGATLENLLELQELLTTPREILVAQTVSVTVAFKDLRNQLSRYLAIQPHLPPHHRPARRRTACARHQRREQQHQR